MLNIAKQIYSGWNTTSTKHELPEAEVIPFGNSSNEKKRLENITKKYTVLKEHNNIPLPGFTLHKTDRKNWGSLDQAWLVIDPRGYLVRISNDNLENILHVTGVTEGLIQEKCVWAREDSQTKMVLVPVSSPTYLEASQNTELIEGKVNLKDVQIGDTVLLQNELVGTYMGVLSLYAPFDSLGYVYKPQVFLRRQIIRIEDAKYHYQTDLKILKVLKKTDNPLTREESMAYLNKDIAGGASYFTNIPSMPSSGYYSSRGMIKLASIHAVPKVHFTLDEITLPEATDLFHTALAICDSGMLILENTHGRKVMIDFPYSFSSFSGRTPTTINSFEIDHIEELVDEPYDRLTQIKDPSKSSYGKTRTRYSLDKFVKFYKIVKHVKQDTYV